MLWIRKKMLIEIVAEIYDKNDTGNAKNERDFYFRCGNANAVGYICKKINIDITKIIKEINKRRIKQQIT